ncbi:MAG: endolytic transglycosylase MltG [Bacteroidales bacterium]|nr:endolytic transglycosylase MltG [Bacteroidales bacterium]
MISKIRKNIIRVIFIFVLLIILAAATTAYFFWRAVYKNNITLPARELSYVFIKTGSDYPVLLKNMEQSGLLLNVETFNWLALRKNLQNHVYPGRYEIKAGMNNDELIDMLRSGSQKPLNVTFNNLRTLKQLAGLIASQIEADSSSIINFIQSDAFLEKYKLSPQESPSLFIPNTYEFYWNTDAQAFVERMQKEYKRFWNEDKIAKAKKINLSLVEVSILASIVEKETNRNDEKPTIAGVYLNRLQKGWKLQADPTTVFAFYLENDSLLNRVYKKHTQMDSPYNTYVNKGLPPGPICLPSISSINAVLNPQKHDYMYFVAKADGSGYHHFSKTYNQHLRYAREHYDGLKKGK